MRYIGRCPAGRRYAEDELFVRPLKLLVVLSACFPARTGETRISSMVRHFGPISGLDVITVSRSGRVPLSTAQPTRIVNALVSFAIAVKDVGFEAIRGRKAWTNSLWSETDGHRNNPLLPRIEAYA